MTEQPILVCSSDWHLRTTVPISRGERDWFEVMEARINQLKTKYPGVPQLVSGDILDRADPPSSLISWAISALKDVELYVVCGNHDAVCHRVSARHEAGYGALCKAGVIRDLEPLTWTHIGTMRRGCSIYSMPWGYDTLPDEKMPNVISVAAVHRYVWADHRSKHPGADEDHSVMRMSRYLEIFDAVSVGDNHIPFSVGRICNHGSLFSLTSAQLTHVPKLLEVYADGTVKVVPFPEIDPQWQPSAIAEKATSVIESLNTIETVTAGFRETLTTQASQAQGQEQVIYNDLLEYLDTKARD